MKKEINKVYVETVVCAGAPGKEARFLRMIESRQAFKRRQDGCLAAWTGTSIDGTGNFAVSSTGCQRNEVTIFGDNVSRDAHAAQRDHGYESTNDRHLSDPGTDQIY